MSLPGLASPRELGLLPTSEPAEPDCLELLCEPLVRVRVRVEGEGEGSYLSS